MAAGFLAACGGSSKAGSSGDKSKSEASSLVTQPVDTTKQAVRGGLMKDRTFGDTATLDILSPIDDAQLGRPSRLSALFQFKPGILKPSENEVAGDVVESWEWAPDGLSVTVQAAPGRQIPRQAAD